MTKKRTGFQNVTYQLPDALYEAIENAAIARGVTHISIVIEALRKGLRVPEAKMPQRRRPGRKREK